jgi:hypothetical protein
MMAVTFSLLALAPGRRVPGASSQLDRRALCGLAPALIFLPRALSAEEPPSAAPTADSLFARDRGTNADALIQKVGLRACGAAGRSQRAPWPMHHATHCCPDTRTAPPRPSQDFYYENGVVPPLRLSFRELPTSQPVYDAFGACVESSCTYVPIKRRYDGYSKYAPDVALGAALFASLDGAIGRGEWATVTAAVTKGSAAAKRPVGPVYTATLRSILLANTLLISENSAELRDALLARFYSNEAGFAATELQRAAEAADGPRALAAWRLGVAAWRSYFTVVNRGIVPKVGEPFQLPEVR